MKVKIVTGYVASHCSNNLEGYAFARLSPETCWFKIMSHTSSDIGWAFTVDVNGNDNHKYFDKMFGEGCWEKTWVGEFGDVDKIHHAYTAIEDLGV